MKVKDWRLDSIRCLAVILVLFCHCVESVFWFTLSKITALPPRIGFLELVSFTVGRLGVPLFLFLTGYLMIPRNYEGAALPKFYKSHFLPMLLCWECWILIYRLINAGIGRIPWSLPDLVLQMLLLKPIDMMHGWYMPMILGMYFFLPYISFGAQKLPDWLLISIVTIGFANWMILPCINLVSQLTGSALRLSWLPDLTAGGGLYGVYLITGYLLYRYREVLKSFFARPGTVLVSVIFIAALVGFTGCFQLYSFRSFHEFRIWYDWPLLIIICLLIWGVLVCSSSKSTAKQLTASLADHSFGMYLVHMPIILILTRFRPFGMNRFLYLALLFALVLLLSWITSFLGSRIPRIGKILFYRK